MLAEHRGAHHFTVGQRKGLGVGAAEPLYVLGIDVGSNRVVAGPKAALATREVRLRGARLHRPPGEVDRVKLRYRSRAVPCRVEGSPERARWRCGCSSRSTAPRRGRPRACCAGTTWWAGGRSLGLSRRTAAG